MAKQIFNLLGFFALFFVIFFNPLGFAAIDWRDSCQHQSCYAIVDAGSSGSRFYIYSADYQTLYTHKIEPGLSSVSLNDIPQYLEHLISQKPTFTVPIYFYGTAGMRLLSDEEQNKRYMFVKKWFEKNIFWNLRDIRTILGKEEGLFAWLAVNHDANEKQGVLEVGGASYQVNIPISEDLAKTLPNDDVSKLILHGQKVFVWTKSYLGLGINEVEKNVTNVGVCYSQSYPLANGSMGNGDISQCIQSLESNTILSILSRFTEAKTILTHQSSISWVVLGAIRYSVTTPPYQFSNQEFNLHTVRQQADSQTCHQRWGTLIAKYTDPYLYRQCLAASYFYASMVDGMGIDENQWIHYPFYTQSTDWTVGALMFNHNHL